MRYLLALLLLGVASTGKAQEDYVYEDFLCPREYGFFPHERQCDAYWSCVDGVPEFRLCGNGLAFDTSNDTREDCNYKFVVDCEGRPDLEPPISTPHCPYLYGIFPDEEDCAVFWSCWDGEASRYQCGSGLAYDRKSRVCNWMDHIPECKAQQSLQTQGVVCPAPGELTATGSFSRHPHSEDCRQYFVCLDGVAREYGCPIGTVFQIGALEGLGQCTDPELVPGCEDYYGDLDLEALKRSQVFLAGGGEVANPRPRIVNPEEAPVVLPA
ncbi:hypothetical protein O3P69_007596 [Scylla paramamosain]|uniref:Chitin-binding type-2 domain-containing protein n=1 Tax=Scylla paramamosain TaxID=85552 RepID=A0AAW0UWA2_SCYPA